MSTRAMKIKSLLAALLLATLAPAVSRALAAGPPGCWRRRCSSPS